MIKKLILGVLALIVVVVAVLCVVVAMQSEDLSITRSASFNAPPEKVFEQINDFHKWEAWSPWAKMDPNMKLTYSGPQSGVGAAYAWAGNDEVGEGKMTIVESKPSQSIKIDLEFIKPFASKNPTDFVIKQNGEKSDLTWTMNTKKNFVMKAMCMVVDMDKMIGADFEKGLAQMKPVVEAATK